jgi:RNA 3'-terminal phosphate cyclase
LSDEPVKLDGSHGEGGGQILRTGLALSAITGHSVEIHSIREKRPKPGLANQHLTGFRALQRICGASVKGDNVGSTAVSFTPRSIEHGEYGFTVGTAGSITLVSVGMNCTLKIRQRGYYPKGGGEVEVTVEASGDFDRMAFEKSGEIQDISGIINITGLPASIGDRIRGSIIQNLPDKYSSIIKINIEHMERGPSQGVGVVLAASDGKIIFGASALGERGKPAEKVGKECADQLMKEIEGVAGVDLFTSDQLLPYLAFSEPGSCYKTRMLTNHTRTNVWTIEQFLGKIIAVDEKPNITGIHKR